MNEPSVFDGPEITMPPTLLHHDAAGRAYEHRELHNMYGLLMTLGTQRGQHEAYPARRPFVLTRAFFSGSQRYAAVWTGDNKASWAHLAASTPMLLSLSVAGIPFVGADVGGFFGNPTTALLVRWYQAAVFHPFLRAHAEFKTKRREPYLFGADVSRQVREALRLRYALLPYLYTLFADHATDGALVMRPLWHEFPRDAHVRASSWWAPETLARSGAAAAEGGGGEEKEERLAAAGEEEAAAEEGAGGKAAAAAAGSGSGGGECDCYKCDAQPCYAPHCSSCGPKVRADPNTDPNPSPSPSPSPSPALAPALTLTQGDERLPDGQRQRLPSVGVLPRAGGPVPVPCRAQVRARRTRRLRPRPRRLRPRPGAVVARRRRTTTTRTSASMPTTSMRTTSTPGAGGSTRSFPRRPWRRWAS